MSGRRVKPKRPQITIPSSAPPQDLPPPLPLQDLGKKVEALQRDLTLIDEHGKCKIPQMQAYETKPSPAMNRDNTVLPYSGKYVKLQRKIAGSDYVNASHLDPVDGYGSTRFIAAQGPTEASVEHFLQMLLEQKVSVVVMLTPLMEKAQLASHSKEKCYQYWPESGKNPTSKKFGEIEVTLVSQSAPNDSLIVERQLRLKLGGQQQKVTQLQFTKWPDRNAPNIGEFETFFTKASKAISAAGSSALNPVVVHCSIGVGRTGVFVALHRLCHSVGELKSQTVDVIRVVQRLRQDRDWMVQTEIQLRFIYEFLLHRYGRQPQAAAAAK